MALFLTNTGLSCLIEGKELDSKQMLSLFQQSKKYEVESSGCYYSYVFDSGLELVFRVSEVQKEQEILGVDVHMSGRCIWKAKPVNFIGEPQFLALSMLMTNPDESVVFATDVVRAALSLKFDNTNELSMQVCAFPNALDVYESREAFEAMVSEGNRLLDRQILPYNYIMAQQKNVEARRKEFFKRNEKLSFFCGPVLAVEERDNGYRSTHCSVATIATQMGHLDVVYSPTQLDRPLEKGCYAVCSALISADILEVSKPLY